MEERDIELLSGYVDQSLSPGELAELEGRLSAEPALAETLVEWCTDEALTASWARSAALTATMSESPAEILEEFRDIDVMTRQLAKRQRRQRLFWLSGAALLLIGAVAIWWFVATSAIGTVVAVTGDTSEVDLVAGEKLRAGQRITLSREMIEFRLAHGVRVVLSGPCECELESPQEIRLLSGQVFADVPIAGRGFTVHTPQGKFVDLGTRFGVEVRQDAVSELHVFSGLVTATVKEQTRDVTSGHAVRLDADSTLAIKPIELEDKFAQQVTAYVEHFAYGHRAIAGQGGWVDSGFTGQPMVTHKQGLNYSDLARGAGDSLQVNAGNRASSPVQRRWSHRFLSAVLRIDDDFPKGMHRDKLTSATLFTFSSEANLSHRLSILIQPATMAGDLKFGAGSSAMVFSDKVLSHRNDHFVVVELRDDALHLWVDPPRESLGKAEAPQADVVLPCDGGAAVRWLTVGEAGNPSYAWFLFDSLRGGSRWSDVTPPRMSAP